MFCVDGRNHKQGLLLWTQEVEGKVIGTPQVSSDGSQIVVVHNSGSTGHLTVLSNSGEILSQEQELYTSFGPVTLAVVDGYETAFWADSSADGYASAGRIYQTRLNATHQIIVRYFFDSSSIVKPTISIDGTGMWIGGREASVHNWGFLPGRRGRLWKTQLPLSRRNVSFRE